MPERHSPRDEWKRLRATRLMAKAFKIHPEETIILSRAYVDLASHVPLDEVKRRYAASGHADRWRPNGSS